MTRCMVNGGKRHSPSEIEDMLMEAVELQAGGKRIADVADNLADCVQTMRLPARLRDSINA